jgi:hypothetical protein
MPLFSNHNMRIIEEENTFVLISMSIFLVFVDNSMNTIVIISNLQHCCFILQSKRLVSRGTGKYEGYHKYLLSMENVSFTFIQLFSN